MRLNALKFALAGGISVSLVGFLATVGAMMKVPGYVEFAGTLTRLYGFYGYSVSWPGALAGGFWGFLEGFVHVGLLGWIYNKLCS